MSLFRKAGQTFQEAKRKVLGGSEQYGCLSCEQAVDGEHEHCPHCGEATVVKVE